MGKTAFPLALLLLASLPSWHPDTGQAPQEEARPAPVYVVNQPEMVRVRGEVRLVEPITGEVSVKGPIPQGQAVILRDLEVGPVSKKEYLRLEKGGTVSAEGFTTMVVSLAGMQRVSPTKGGEVGAILLPAEDLPLRAWEEHGQKLFALETHARSEPNALPYFASEPLRAVVAFPRYRVLLYNESDRTVSVTLYIYLTN